MFRLISLTILLFIVSAVFTAEGATYAFKSTTYNWEATNQNIVWDQSRTNYPRDDDKQVVNLGFTFNFAGENYNQVRIHANGVLQFGADTEFHRQFENTNLPVTNLPPNFCQFFFICYPGSQADRLMAIYWDDINPILGGTVRYQTKGAAPNRRFVVSWENVPHYNFGGQYSFQAILYENGDFVYQYGGGNTSGVSSTIGVEVNNNDFTLYSFNSPFSYAGTAILWYQPSGQPQRLAEYWFEEGLWSYQPNEVIDWTGNGYNGNALGNAQSTADGWVCRAADIPLNFDDTVSGINTNIDVDAAIGRTGSISFWYNSNQRWNRRNNQLLDASGPNERWFYLTKKNNGRLRFAVSDSMGATVVAETPNDNSTAGDWRHIAITWRLASGNNQTVLRIYVDGNLISSQQGTTNGMLPAGLGTLILGDNVSGIVHNSGGSLNSADGRIDEVKVYNFELSNADVQNDMSASHDCIFINHLRIEHDGQGLTCAAENITLKACSNNNCSTLYPGSVTATVTANGANLGSINFSGGSANFAINQPLPESITLGGTLSPAALFPTQCVGGTGAASCEITFVDTGWLFDPIDSQVSGVNFNTGIRLQAVRKDDNTGVCQTILSGPQPVDLRLSCVDPVSCSADAQMQFQFRDAANQTRQLSKDTFTSYNLDFAGGVAELVLANYNDVGSIRIDAQKRMETGALLTGSSNAFVVRPHSLVVAAVERLNGTANPGTTSETPGFVAAGEPFRVKLESLNAQGGRTANFGRETAPERLTVTLAELNYPATGRDDEALLQVNGGFSNVSTIAGQVASNDVSWHEFGTIKLSARLTDNDYLGVGDVSNKPVSGNIGRFYPAAISAELKPGSTEMYTPACGGFSYMAQPFSVDVMFKALNINDEVTQNYFDEYATADFEMVAETNSDVIENRLMFINVPDEPSIFPLIWEDGVSIVTAKASFIRGSGPSAKDGPYMLTDTVDSRVRLGVAIANERDAVGIAFPDLTYHTDAMQLGSSAADFRFGRLVLDNTYGPEQESLPVRLQAQYWHNPTQRFINNTEDNCTALSAGAVVQPGSSNINLQLQKEQPYVGAATLTLQASSNPQAAFTALQQGSSVINGIPALLLPATGERGRGEMEYLAPVWLQDDWDGDGAFDENPQAEFMFGRFRGNPRQISWRELFQ